jgi:hypothetical protein
LAGNTEAASRVGINVETIRTSVFIIGSTMAAVGWIVAAPPGQLGRPRRGRQQHDSLCRGRGRADVYLAREVGGRLDLVCAAADGRRAEARAVRSVGRSLGLRVGNPVNLINPEMVICWRVRRHVLRAVEPSVLRRLAGSPLPPPTSTSTWLVPRLGENSIVLGAAELALTPLLDDHLGTLAARG